MIEIYSYIVKANRDFIARQNSIQQWYELFEKINILMQDYTVDYEEYFNRQMVGCVNSWWLLTWENFKRNIWTWWYCTEFTAYWNENSTQRNVWSTLSWKYHDIYQCSSRHNESANAVWRARVVERDKCWRLWSKQSYGQYKALFTDVKQVIDEGDDTDLWTMVNSWVQAIEDGNNIQELYLISHDGKSRLFFRRKLFTWNDLYSQYKIQILRLRWFDAGKKHTFNDTTDNEWIYDRQIDTWACDTSMWFVWTWQSVWWAYSDYYLPKDVDDCWIDLTYWDTSITARNLTISPLWDPDLFWAEERRQINPYMKIFVINGVYLPFTSKDSIGSSILDFKVPLETTINMKDFYKE